MTKKLTQMKEEQERQKIQKSQTEALKKAFNELVGEKEPEGLTVFERQLRVSYRYVADSYQVWLKTTGEDLFRQGKRFEAKMTEGDFEDLYTSPPIQSMGSKLDGLAERFSELRNIIRYYLAGKLFGDGNWK